MAETRKKRPNLIRLLMDMHSTSKSGVLRFTRGNIKKQVVVIEGRLAFAESSVPDEHLARVMIGMDLISRKQLPEITEAMKAGQTSDQAIISVARLTAPQMEAGLRQQAFAIIASLMGMADCELEFFEGERLVKRQLNLGAPLPQILVSAARWATRNGLVPNWMKTLEKRISPAERKAFLDLPLDSNEAYAYSLLQRPARIEEVLPLLPGEPDKAKELIQILLLLGLVQSEQFMTSSHESIQEPSGGEDIEQKLDEIIARFERANFYEILGVKPDAKEDVIKEAYHALARQYHSDRFQSRSFSDDLRTKAGKLFTFITGAYTTLSDSASRSSYDSELRKEKSKHETPAGTAAAAERDDVETAETLYRAARIAQQKGDLDKAIRLLKECVWLRADVAKYHHFLGVYLADNPRTLKEAEQHLQKAIELNYGQSASYIELGRLYIKAKLFRRAEAQFLKALEWDPGNAEAARLLEQVAES